MDQKIVYSKTGKGVLEIKNKAGKLSRELARVLSLVDGKSAVGDIIAKSKLSDDNLDRCLKQLEEGGYIKEFASLSGAMSSTSTFTGSAGSYVDDLDFTTQLSPGKRVYSNAASEFRSIESADRQRAEADATRKRQAIEDQKKEDSRKQAREEAVRMARMEAERKAKEASAKKARQQSELDAKRQAVEMEKTTRDLAKILEAERQALDKSDKIKNAEKARKAKEEAERKQREEEERKQREEQERKQREEAERKQREEAERKKREEEERKRREEEKRKQREAEERKQREAEERKQREAEERRQREEEKRKQREAEERKQREAEERKQREAEERRQREAEERKQREEEERKQREEEERKQREEEERKQREEEERRQREEEERKQREEEERRQREEEERRQREEEERRQREEEERRQREEEERRQREEEERLRREAEDRRREEEDARRAEEDRRRREEEEARRAVSDEENRSAEEEERRQRDEEERLQRDAEEDLRREEEAEKRREEDARRLREEEEWRQEEEAEKRRNEEDERRLREDGQRRREEEAATPEFNIGGLDLPSAPDLSESVDTRIDRSTSALEVNEDFAVNFEQQQEVLRKQALEEERLRREEEEAQLQLEREQREEDARLEAEHREAMEAEMRMRVEQEKEERAERERSKREEYERKIQEEEERKRRETERKAQEDQARIDSERKQREEELTRRRKQAEGADQRRAELKALQKSGKARSPIERIVPKVIGLVVVVGLLIGAIHIVPLSGYIPAVEKRVSDNIGDPVTISSMKISMTSGVQLKLSGVNIGTTQDVSLNEVTVTPELGSLFGDTLVIDSIRADGGRVVKEALSRLPGWLSTSASDQKMRVRSIELRGVALELQTFKMSSLNADVRLSRIGKVTAASVRTTDGKLAAEITPINGRIEVSINASNWALPIGTPLELTDFTATGVASKTGLRLNEWQAGLYGGTAKGSGNISWDSDWQADAKFEFSRIATDELLAVFTRTAKVSGNVSGNGSFSARAGGLDALLDRLSLRTGFEIRKGNLDGVDLVRALQAGSAGSQGGSTKFEEIKGEAIISNGRYSYRNVRLSAGILSADSNFDISSSQDVSGRVSVALRSSAQRMNADLNVTGSLKGVVLKP